MNGSGRASVGGVRIATTRLRMILAVAIGRRKCPVVAICGVGLSGPYLRRFQVKFELVLTGRDPHHLPSCGGRTGRGFASDIIPLWLKYFLMCMTNQMASA